MDYSSLVSGASSFVSGYISQSYANKVATIQANTANVIRQGNNKVIDAYNAKQEVLTATQRWAQGVRNSRVYEGVAKNQEAAVTNFNRSRDARTRGNFSEAVRFAEEDGRQQAAAAASGITGSVVDMINMTSNLRYNMQKTARVEGENQITYDFNLFQHDSRMAQLDAIDYTPIFDNPMAYDYGNNIAKTQSAISAGLANNGALKQLTQGVSKFNFNFGQTDYGLGGLASSGTSGMGD